MHHFKGTKWAHTCAVHYISDGGQVSCPLWGSVPIISNMTLTMSSYKGMRRGERRIWLCLTHTGWTRRLAASLREWKHSIKGNETRFNKFAVGSLDWWWKRVVGCASDLDTACFVSEKHGFKSWYRSWAILWFRASNFKSLSLGSLSVKWDQDTASVRTSRSERGGDLLEVLVKGKHLLCQSCYSHHHPVIITIDSAEGFEVCG